jgi:hypothetical protein
MARRSYASLPRSRALCLMLLCIDQTLVLIESVNSEVGKIP